MVEKDPRFDGVPDNTVTVGVPPRSPARSSRKVLGGVADRIARLANLRVRKNGTIKKVVTIWRAYELDVNVVEVVASGHPASRTSSSEATRSRSRCP